jgi:hypothetical protein
MKDFIVVQRNDIDEFIARIQELINDKWIIISSGQHKETNNEKWTMTFGGPYARVNKDILTQENEKNTYYAHLTKDIE